MKGQLLTLWVESWQLCDDLVQMKPALVQSGNIFCPLSNVALSITKRVMLHLFKWLTRRRYSLQEGPAHRVIFYYHGEEPTFLEDAFVAVYKNGMVEIKHRSEHVTTHVQNVEILWKGKAGSGNPTRNFTLVKNDSRP